MSDNATSDYLCSRTLGGIRSGSSFPRSGKRVASAAQGSS